MCFPRLAGIERYSGACGWVGRGLDVTRLAPNPILNRVGTVQDAFSAETGALFFFLAAASSAARYPKVIAGPMVAPGPA
ncbi:hypothetical protein NSK11_contig00010-0040 [Nocardia seriolae]|uniref:Uncharacterized protein n=1 Tax=Nocardia seriolae TaxID=37332 RepID=A0ABC9YMW7_9NOCA|nr:hypothetical protein NSERKGN1266_75090 [Nocardia seriolae]BEK99616.1 hypothetical protein NSER024013_75220 [Nocardia seriolae]GAM44789.1 hypothetical protein NS07_v2contig00007-0075 [Nocardia seriolae]GAP26789.1 hypothetical protein NSK11_contig00010-0040 [Nocardia seriolae]GEM22521.1 hypothetical protein NS2_07600 [Nocardia seriolae NBRC 15557]